MGSNGSVSQSREDNEGTDALEGAEVPHRAPRKRIVNRRWAGHLLSRYEIQIRVCLRDTNHSISIAPYSFTTKPTLELHIHSGRALISALLSSLALLPNLRPAEPGEFTRQALLGGRLDLTQVEGLHDLIEADTEVQRVWALGSAGVSTFY